MFATLQAVSEPKSSNEMSDIVDEQKSDVYSTTMTEAMGACKFILSFFLVIKEKKKWEKRITLSCVYNLCISEVYAVLILDDGLH